MNEKKESAGARARTWLVAAREAKGMSQAAVAAAAGISQPSYSSIESGNSQPRVLTAKGIAKALGKESWSWVYDGRE